MGGLLALGARRIGRAGVADAQPADGVEGPGVMPTSNGPHDAVASATTDPSWVSDPDLTTPENEVELNARARLAHALLLFRDERSLRWDLRAELFVRYGMPAAIEYNPPEATLEYFTKRRRPVFWAPPELRYPFNMQVWHYPQLGLSVVLWDQGIH